MLSTADITRTQHLAWVQHTKGLVRTPLLEPVLDFAGIPHKTLDVPLEACLPMPAHYRVPREGKACEVAKHVSIALLNRRSIFLHGLPGTGKDAIFHAWSAITHQPALVFQIQPGTDIQSWFWQRGFDTQGTHDEEGELLRALRDGYQAPNGHTIPYMILFSDFDRADRSQAESLRLIMDSIAGRVKGPGGKTYPVFPGTLVVATANSAGAGDTRGRCISSNPLDASILDRFERKFQSEPLAWEDEATVLALKFPRLSEKHPKFVDRMREITASIRQVIEQNLVAAEFSHRALCGWFGHAEDISLIRPETTDRLIQAGSVTYLASLPDPDSVLAIQRAIDPYIQTVGY
jgi:MoxR-like ATPase